MLLEVHRAKVDVDGKTVLANVEFVVKDPGVYVILGPNGSGKTSFLSALAGRPGYRLLGGIARFKGVDLSELGLLDRARRGLVLGYQIPPRLRGVRLVDLVNEIDKVYMSKREFEWIEERLGIKKLMYRGLGSLSGGERRRVEVYLVMLQRPSVALLDEPDSGVDVDWLDRLAEVIEWAVRAKNISIVLVSHTTGFIWRLVGMNIIREIYLAWGGSLTSTGLEPEDALRVLRKEGFSGLAQRVQAQCSI
jgi:Fe-S cluster assembly ATP-binding protein